MCRELPRNVSGEVSKSSALVWKDIEDSVLAVFETNGKPCDGLRFVVDQRLRVAQKLLDVLFMPGLGFERQQKALRRRFGRRGGGQLVGQHVKANDPRRRGKQRVHGVQEARSGPTAEVR